MEEWLIIRNFFHGLNKRLQDHMDVTAGGAFLSLDVAGARMLIDKVASNQSWKEDRQPAHSKGMRKKNSIIMECRSSSLKKTGAEAMRKKRRQDPYLHSRELK
jgi:hypothetical protein